MLCPSDCYKIWKRGSRIRVDTTLVGFERLQWIRGNVSFLFIVKEKTSSFFMLDHDKKLFEEVDKLEDYTEKDVEEDLNIRFNTDIVTAKVKKPMHDGDDRQTFERQKSGLFGLGGDKKDTVSGYDTDVFDIKDIEFITKTRREHIRDQPQKEENQNSFTDIEKVLNDQNLEAKSELPASSEVEGIIEDAKKLLARHVPSLERPKSIPAVDHETFFPDTGDPKSLSYMHVGRAMDFHERVKTLKLSIWMAHGFPLTVRQLIPVFEIMSPTSKHVQKLREFISMDLPAGFPVKVELPLFAVLTAQVTFQNFLDWKTSASIPKPTSLHVDSKEGEWFEIPEDYKPGVVIKNILKIQDDS